MKILLLLAFTLVMNTANANIMPVYHPEDTTLKAMKHWSEDEFMQESGTDDSSRALISYYFDHRRRGMSTMIWSGSATAAAITATGIIARNLNDGPGTGEPGAFRGVALAVIAGSVILTFLSVFSGGFMTRMVVYTKNKLHKDLLRYHAGRGLQKMIGRARRYRMFLQAEKSSH